MGRQLVRVGIIGGGASGLAQLKQLIDAFARPKVMEKKELEVVLFEKNPEIGGVW
jgi:cation diffusion facilitator CzcD-associated flavoprotein CzcO